MDWVSLILIVTLGVVVLFSYYVVLVKKDGQNKSYTDHPYWLGMNKKLIYILVFFQILAMFGFIVSSASWVINPPESGIMGEKTTILPIMYTLFLVSATLWPIATYMKCSLTTVFSLICTATSSLMLLIGSIQEENRRWRVILGWIFLSITTVVGDGLIWNYHYISKYVLS